MDAPSSVVVAIHQAGAVVMTFLTVEDVAEKFHTTPDHIRRKAANPFSDEPFTAEHIAAMRLARAKKELARELTKIKTNAYDRCMARFAVLALDQLRGLPRVTDQCESGVYFLWRGPQLVYVGRSQNVAVRVGQHRYFNKGFTHATFELVSWRCIAPYEIRYIQHYEPPLNIMGVR